MDKKIKISAFILLSLALGCNEVKKQKQESSSNISSDKSTYQAQVIDEEIIIDGKADEAIWKQSEWYSIDQLWVGKKVNDNDLSGKFKLAWSQDYLYVLAQIKDDTLMDIHDDKLVQYWDDDCLEIFVDENASGGNHQYNYNAFAYHIALDYSVADIGSDQNALLLDDHVVVKRTSVGDIHTWEVSIKIFDDSFSPNKENLPLTLVQNKTMGFAMAYCDNDYSSERETFIGSEVIKGDDKNRGWIDASIFGTVRLIK